MSTYKLAIAVHNHQPVGNFQAIFDEAHRRAYLPFLELVRQHPAIRLSLHQSGILWEWQKKAHPEFFRLVGELVDRGQIELLTGGFYEPILVAIPERDVVGQIARLSGYLNDHFEVTPQGLWLAERVWEPHLPRPLAQSGVRYLPIDDTHFLQAGFEESQLSGTYVTEHEGHALTLLPIRKRLRYLVPFGEPQEIIDYLKRDAERKPDGLAVYADDGEKFGIWPHTHAHCYEEGWLRRFFEAVEQNNDWLEVVPLAEAARLTPLGRAYLPSASYAEMKQWAMPATAILRYDQFESGLKESGQFDRFGQFVSGGHWRGFLTKYEEANLLHKKMLAVSAKLDRFLRAHPQRTTEASAARDRLFAGQCNCGYWHGVFGGLYLPHIRQAVYSALIEAETLIDELSGADGVRIESRDYDADGSDEVLVETQAFSAVFRPHRGAALVHLGLRRHNFDVTDTLTRRREAYHLKVDEAVVGSGRKRTRTIHDRIVAKEPGLAQLLTDDWYLKRCFIDHFFTSDVDFDRFRTNHFGEEGDFIIEPFEHMAGPDPNAVTFVRNGHLWRPGGIVPLCLTKRFVFSESSDEILVTYELVCPEGCVADVLFGVENNFNFQAGHAEDRFVLVDGVRPENSFLDGYGAHPAAERVALVDHYRCLGIRLVSDRPAELWRLPIWTVSQSDGGFERVYQGTTLVSVYRLTVTSTPTRITQRLAAGGLAAIGIESAVVRSA